MKLIITSIALAAIIATAFAMSLSHGFIAVSAAGMAVSLAAQIANVEEEVEGE